jgi:cysteine desulfurase
MPVYLDHNASTPIDPEALDTLLRVSRDVYANPSSIEHSYGNAASDEVELARSKIAEVIGCRPQEVIFTSGSTEANNLAILGSYPALKDVGRGHIITSQIEHPSVLACFDFLEKHGARVTRLPVEENCVVDMDALKDSVGSDTGLVSIMAANNETGVLQPMDQIGAICEEAGALFHTDYSQASAYIPIQLKNSPIHLASFSAHKAYGPKGVGVLYRSLRKPRVKLDPIVRGGGQEYGLRSGTYNTAAIAAMGTAFEMIPKRIEQDVIRLSKLRDSLQFEFISAIERVMINGANVRRLPNTLSLSIDGVEPLALMHRLRNDVIFSASSACSTGKVETSHVLLAMFGECPMSRETFRLGLGRTNLEMDIENIVRSFSSAAEILRNTKL